MLNHLQPLIKRSVVRKHEAGSIVVYQGEIPRAACVLVSGVVRVYSISHQGDHQIVIFHVAGEIFPSSWIFGKSTAALFFYEAVSDCEIAYVPRKDLIDFMLEAPERMHSLLDYFTTNYSASLVHINALEQPRARDKLVYILFYLCHRYANDPRSTFVTIPFNLTHQQLASLVGLTRETTATEIHKLKNEGIIDYSNQKYTINLKKIIASIGEDSFENVDIVFDNNR